MAEPAVDDELERGATELGMPPARLSRKVDETLFCSSNRSNPD